MTDPAKMTPEQQIDLAFFRIIEVLEKLEDPNDVCTKCIFEDAHAALEEWKPKLIEELSSRERYPTVNDLFNLVVRPTSIGTEYYLRENLTGKLATSLVKRIDW